MRDQELHFLFGQTVLKDLSSAQDAKEIMQKLGLIILIIPNHLK
jgi:hypothetical protein